MLCCFEISATPPLTHWREESGWVNAVAAEGMEEVHDGREALLRNHLLVKLGEGALVLVREAEEEALGVRAHRVRRRAPLSLSAAMCAAHRSYNSMYT